MKPRGRFFPATLAGALLFVSTAIVLADTHYVDINNLLPEAPYTNWTMAANSIQDAVDAAESNDTVLVADGTYFPLDTIAVTNGITIASTNGAEGVTVDGGGVFSDYGVFYVDGPGVLNGFTIVNGAAPEGGGAYCANGGTVQNCILSGNYVDLLGGGAVCYDGGVISNCTLSGNTASDGGGAACFDGGMLRNCTIRSNLAQWGGGVLCDFGGTIENCAIISNTASNDGGGVYCFEDCRLDNCTISGNSAINGAGIYCDGDTALNNCIIWDNGGGANWTNTAWGNVSWTNSCTIPPPSNTVDCITQNPRFVADYRLHHSSPCIDAGANLPWMVGATDLDGNDRIMGGTVDMGAYEHIDLADLPVVAITNLDNTVYHPADTFTVVGTNDAQVIGHLWWTNTANGANGTLPVSDGTFEIPDIPLQFFGNTITVYGTNGTGTIAQDSITVTRDPGGSTIYYASTNGAGIWPYDSWANATNDIQEAIDEAGPGDIVLVGGGTYVPSTTITISNEIMVVSLNGSASVIVDGGGSHRVFSVNGQAILDGFTIVNGGGGFPFSGMGGGAYCANAGTIQNCIITGNLSFEYGGGAYCDDDGTIRNCTISSNLIDTVFIYEGKGGGVYCANGGMIDNCIINGNSFTQTDTGYGGGAYCDDGGIVTNCILSLNEAQLGGGAYCSGGLLADCTLSSNYAGWGGGVMCDTDGMVSNSTLEGNVAYYTGGGAIATFGIFDSCILNSNWGGTLGGGGGGASCYYGGIFRSCIFVGNMTPDYGGGVYCASNGVLENCTLSGNSASTAGGGIYCDNGAILYNCIVWGNTNGGNWGEAMPGNSIWFNCCTAPMPTISPASIVDDPLFMAVDDYHLQPASPCIDAGTELPWEAGTTDLDGFPRISGFAVDIGAYEHFYPPVVVDITNSNETVADTVETYTIGGTNNSWIIGNMWWINAATGETDTFPAPGGPTYDWQVSNIPLEFHNNTITVFGTNVWGHTAQDSVTITRDGWAALDVTNGNTSVSEAVTNYTVSGTNNSSTIGNLWWTNAATGANGILPVSNLNFQIPEIRLEFHANIITVFGTNAWGDTTHDSVVITRYGWPVLDITNENENVFMDSCVIGGTNNMWVVGNLWWTNFASGANGSQPVTETTFTITGIPLAPRENTIEVRGTNALGEVTQDSVVFTYNAPAVDITNHNESVPYYVETYSISGTNNMWTVGNLWWANDANGTSGSQPVTGTTFTITGIPVVIHANTITVYGTNQVGVTVFDSVTISLNYEHPGSSPYHYVALNGDSIWPYTNWSTAATNIQLAVDAAAENDTVLVADGVYSNGTTATPGYFCMNRVSITKDIIVRSTNGTDTTFIVGAEASAGSNGTDAVRGVYMSAGLLSGFTVTNGHTQTSGDYSFDRCGGGIYMTDGEGIVSNCMLSGNSANNQGGGSFGGTLKHCSIISNSAAGGGGSSLGILNHCTIISNSALFGGGGSGFGALNSCTISYNVSDEEGGGSYGGTLNNCTISYNVADEEGGGSCLSTLNNCTLIGNSSHFGGGGSFGAMLNNCNIISNTAPKGGGSWSSTLNNCTISYNSSDYGGGSYVSTLKNCILSFNSATSGGGSSFCRLNNCTISSNSAVFGGGSNEDFLTNCIVYFNTANQGANWNDGGPVFFHCCTTPHPGGTGNITDDPRFVAVGDFYLRPNSPCIDSGAAIASVVDDVDGLPRPLDGDNNGSALYDIGAYEFSNEHADSDGDGLSDGDELYLYGTSPVSTNTDGDVFDDYEEYVADTDGADSSDWFHMVDIAYTSVWFNSSDARIYTLYRCTNLVDGVWESIPEQSGIPGTGGLDSLSDTTNYPASFYQLEVGIP